MQPLVDCNVHLWDQASNPVFWLSDRTLVRDMLGDYDSLPDVYTLADYLRDVARHDVHGIVWSDAGAGDPVAAAGWVQQQCDELDVAGAPVTLGDPADDGFADLVERFCTLPLARSVRVRLVAALAHRGGTRGLGVVAGLARALPALRIVVDHFGWPENPSEETLARHGERLSAIACASNTAMRIDAIGTVFGDWTTDRIRPWLRAAIDAYGPQRCMLGSDLPIERLRSGFGRLYDTYRDIFSDLNDADRDALFRATATHWYGIRAYRATPRELAA